MTREEALEELERLLRHWDLIDDGIYDISEHDEEAVEFAISALRGPTREQVERMFPGCDFCKKELDDYPYIVAHGDYSSSDTCYEPGYCPICSRPLTDEAVDMMLKRMEEMTNEH